MRVLLVVVLALGGCADLSSNMRVGTAQSYMSLKDQREATLTIRDYPTLPEGWVKLGTVDASRCHRNSLQAAPTEDDVKNDLKAAAYAKGADGIMGVKINKTSGLLQNCWVILSGEAVTISSRGVKP